MPPDTFNAAKRSWIMSLVRSEDTTPELFVRRLVHRMGYRFRLHRRDLPGCPDMVFPSRRKVIFVHGCFWHQHRCKRGRRIPKSNNAYWRSKLGRNVERDRKNQRRLRTMGWDVLVLWECQLHMENIEALTTKIHKFMFY